MSEAKRKEGCEVVLVDGDPVLVRGHISAEDQTYFAEIVREAKAIARGTQPTDSEPKNE